MMPLRKWKKWISSSELENKVTAEGFRGQSDLSFFGGRESIEAKRQLQKANKQSLLVEILGSKSTRPFIPQWG